MNEKILNILEKALKHYGKTNDICVPSDLDGEWQKFTDLDSFDITKNHYLDIRHALVNQGLILEEDIVGNTYIICAKVGQRRLNRAMVITHVEGNTIGIAAYAKEGLIKQHIAQKAVQQVKESVLKNCG